jgi:uncharacterized protein YndB with AHSA1/START domain
MSPRSTRHDTFVIERTYPASPARVFAAWSRLEAKSRWFGCHEDWQVLEHTLDFRPGGREVWRGGPRGGVVHANHTLYYDIVPDERIVYSYEMHLGETRISVSLTTVELRPAGTGTCLVFTEQDVFLDEYQDAGSREEGTRVALDALARAAAQ